MLLISLHGAAPCATCKATQYVVPRSGQNTGKQVAGHSTFLSLVIIYYIYSGPTIIIVYAQ